MALRGTVISGSAPTAHRDADDPPAGGGLAAGATETICFQVTLPAAAPVPAGGKTARRPSPFTGHLGPVVNLGSDAGVVGPAGPADGRRRARGGLHPDDCRARPSSGCGRWCSSPARCRRPSRRATSGSPTRSTPPRLQPGDVVSVPTGHRDPGDPPHRLRRPRRARAESCAARRRQRAADADTYRVSHADRVLFHVPRLGYVVGWLFGPVGLFLLGLYAAFLLSVLLKKPPEQFPDRNAVAFTTARSPSSVLAAASYVVLSARGSAPRSPRSPTRPCVGDPVHRGPARAGHCHVREGSGPTGDLVVDRRDRSVLQGLRRRGRPHPRDRRHVLHGQQGPRPALGGRHQDSSRARTWTSADSTHFTYNAATCTPV